MATMKRNTVLRPGEFGDELIVRFCDRKNFLYLGNRNGKKIATLHPHKHGLKLVVHGRSATDTYQCYDRYVIPGEHHLALRIPRPFIQ